MDAPYQTLTALYRIAEKEVRPLTYQFTPRELILCMQQDWQHTQADLLVLSREGLVIIRNTGTYTICLTQAGWEKAQEMDGKIASDISFSSDVE